MRSPTRPGACQDCWTKPANRGVRCTGCADKHRMRSALRYARYRANPSVRCADCGAGITQASTRCDSCARARRYSHAGSPWKQAERELAHVTFGLPYHQQTREQRNAVTARSIEIAVARGIWPAVSDEQRRAAA